jgi:hypothetical protein
MGLPSCGPRGGQYERWKDFADDLDGWTVPDLVNPEDVNALR